MAVTFVQTDLTGTVGRTTRIKVAATFGAGSDTGGAHTFTRPFRAAPVCTGTVRRDASASVITGRISALTATAATILTASATGDEVIDMFFEGELA